MGVNDKYICIARLEKIEDFVHPFAFQISLFIMVSFEDWWLKVIFFVGLFFVFDDSSFCWFFRGDFGVFGFLGSDTLTSSFWLFGAEKISVRVRKMGKKWEYVYELFQICSFSTQDFNVDCLSV